MNDQEFQNVMDCFVELEAIYADVYGCGNELLDVKHSLEENQEKERQEAKDPEDETDV